MRAGHTQSPTPQPGLAGRSRNPSSNTHIHTAHPCQEWLGASGAHTQPNTPARSGGGQPKPEPKHTPPHRALVPGVAGCKRSTHTAEQPSQEWRGAAKTRAETHTPTPRTRARSGWVQAEHAHSPTPQPGVASAAETRAKTHRPTPRTRARIGWVQAEQAHSRTTQPGVVGRSQNPSPNTHTHTAHPCQEWLGARGAHTQPNKPARSGGAQPKSEPKHTHPHRAPMPGVAGCKPLTHTRSLNSYPVGPRWKHTSTMYASGPIPRRTT